MSKASGAGAMAMAGINFRGQFTGEESSAEDIRMFQNIHLEDSDIYHVSHFKTFEAIR